MRDYIHSSPYFFRLIKIAFLGGILVLLVLAFFFPAPLQEPADVGRVPNPAKSAWFLLWMQELVSYSNALIYLILALAAGLACLPWWPGIPRAERARWFPAEQKIVSWLTLTVLAGIVLLTLVVVFFRGENWAFVLPF